MSGNNNTEESDEAINQHLEDLGLLEEGMTAEDKRNLWAVIKISKDTAHAEEQDRQKRARRSLQFDEVSSRTEMLSESKPTSGSDVENDVNTSPEKMNGSDDEAEEEKGPKVASVAPHLRTTPQTAIAPTQRTTATVVPLHRSGVGDRPQNIENSLSTSTPSHSVTPKIVLSSSQQDGSDGEHSPSLYISSMTPSARRGLRSQTGMSSSKLSPVREIRESSPGNLSSKVIIHDVLDAKESVKEREQDSEALSISFKSDASSTRKETIIKVTVLDDNYEQDSSSPVPGQSSKNFDYDEIESRASSEHESSPVRKIRHSLKTSLNFEQNVSKEIGRKTCEMKNEVDNENCSEQSNISALDEEETVKMDKEKSASVGPASDNVPSPLSDSLLNESPSPSSGVNNTCSDVKKIGKDKERNIDAFNCDRSNYERTLKVRKVKRTCSRQPFYIPPYKMNIHTYIAYFKRCVNEQAARLIEVQRKNHKCVPWGDPVVVGESNSRALVCLDQGDQKSNSVTNLQRYNFRDRKIAHQKVDTIYEDPGDVPSEDDDMFINVPKKEKNTVKNQEDTTDNLFDTLLEKSAPEKDDNSEKEGLTHGEETNTIANSSLAERQGSMKRKSDSSDDQMFDQDEKSSEPQEKRAAPSPWLTTNKEVVPPVAVKRKKFGTVMCNADPARGSKDLHFDDHDEDFEPSKKVLRKRGDGKRATSSLWKKHKEKLPSKDTDIFLQDEGVDDESDLFADLDKAEGVGDSSRSRPGSKQDSDVIRPGPLKLRKQGRRRVQQNKEEADELTEEEKEEKQNEGSQRDDISVVYDAGGSSDKKEQDQDLVPCPICRKTFPPKDIEAHASECNEYCEEEISPDEQHISPTSSPDIIQRSPHGSISQQCWSEFDNGQAIEEDHYTRQRNQSQRPQTQQEMVLEEGEGEIEAPLSPIHCFVPISAQQDSEIDYYNQFRVSAASTEAIMRRRVVKKRTYKRKKKRGPKKQRGKKRKKTAPARTKITSSGCAKKLKDVW